MKKFKFLHLFVAALLFSCGSDDETGGGGMTPSVTITASDATFSVPEDFEVGGIVGTVEATSSEGSVSFSINSQTPADALTIDSASGELTTLGTLDRMANPTHNLVIGLTSGETTSEVNVTIEVGLASFCVGTIDDIFDGELILVNNRFEESIIEAESDGCNMLTIQGAGLVANCSIIQTLVMTLEPSSDDPMIGTVTFEGGTFDCISEGDELVEFELVVGTFDLNTGQISYRGISTDINGERDVERTIVGIGGVVPENPDRDFDGILNEEDTCPDTFDGSNTDTDGDGIGDVCDDDDDNDGILDVSDNCPLTANADQADADGDAIGDVCDEVDDGACTSSIETSFWSGLVDIEQELGESSENPGGFIPACGSVVFNGVLNSVSVTGASLLFEYQGVRMNFTEISPGLGTIEVNQLTGSRLDAGGGNFFDLGIQGTGAYNEAQGIIVLTYDLTIFGAPLAGGTTQTVTLTLQQ